jgi:hypothetical protein
MLFADIYDIIMTPIVGPIVAMGIGLLALALCLGALNKVFGERE